MTTSNKVSKLVPQQFPEFVNEYGPDLIRFLQCYYEWMEQTQRPVDMRQNYLDYIDIDRTLDEFVDRFHDEFMRSLPKNISADRRLVLKHIREQLYRAKGTERGFEFLFRILFNEHVEFYYPGRDIIRASDGKWFIEKSLTATQLFVGTDEIDSLVGTAIYGSNSGGIALIERITTQIVSSVTQYTVTLNTLRGDLEAGEIAKSQTDDSDLFLVDTYTIHPGRWLNTDGFLSADKYLQDNYFYQEFSYVLQTGKTFDQYKNVVEKLLHPAGTIAFGQFVAKSDILLTEPNFPSTDFLITSITSTANLTPIVAGTINFDDLSSPEGLLEFHFVFDQDVSVTPEVERFTVLSGTVSVANSAVLGDYFGYTLSDFAGWSLADFTSGRGYVGTGTSFLTDLANNQGIYVHDNSSVDPDSYNEVWYVSSNKAFLAKFQYPYGDLASGQIESITTV